MHILYNFRKLGGKIFKNTSEHAVRMFLTIVLHEQFQTYILWSSKLKP